MLKSLAGFCTLACASSGFALGETLPARRAGEMDIHHIDTGSGNCTLIVTPEGTSILIDAGASIALPETSSAPRPDASRRPGEWQARYVLRHVDAPRLDYLIVTHIHPDHVGDVSATSPRSADGRYELTGVSDVDRVVPITMVIDRAYPDYGSTPPPQGAFAANYLAWLKDRVETGRAVQRADVGSDAQVRTPAVRVRILSANAKVWDGQHAESRVPSYIAAADEPAENTFSLALRLTCGRFSYFTGGDLNYDTQDGRLPWMDIESPVARVAGRTEVATADHHGYFDACGPAFVRELDAQAYIIQAWDIGHPGSAQMQRMLNAWPGQPSHDVFATDLLPGNQLMNRRFAPQLKSRRGHVVVRVAPGGNTYRIFVLDSSNENDFITGAFGPYTCRA